MYASVYVCVVCEYGCEHVYVCLFEVYVNVYELLCANVCVCLYVYASGKI